MPSQTERLNTALAGRYRIDRHLGEGGMATVYLCDDLKHDRKVALKLLKPELAAVLGAERFVQEIKTTAALQHPHILPLFDSGTADGFLYYVMPYIEGETLREKLNRETQLGVDEALRIAEDVGDALDYAHRHGVIHRDIKPENILLHDGRPMVADFGIALAVSAAAGGRMTETGLSLGTPHYMSPEQATAEKEITGRSDIYSLASVLYEMLSGNPPHMGSSAQQIIMKIIAEPVEAVTKFRRSVPPHVAAAVSRALEKLPADRFDTASAFAHALRDPTFSVGTTSAAIVGSTTWRSPRVLVLVVAGLALLAVAYVAGRATAPMPDIVDVGLPDTAQFAFVDDNPFGTEMPGLAVSPAGDFIVYVARRGETTELWYRSLNGLEARPLPGTKGARMPTLSPDAHWVAFYSGRVIKKVSVDGAVAATNVAEVVDPHGMAWTTNDELLAGKDFGLNTERFRISDGRRSQAGGSCAWPALVPGTNDLICSAAGTNRYSRVVTLGPDGALPSSPTAGVVLGDSARPVQSAQTLFVGDNVLIVDEDGNLVTARYDRVRRTLGPRRIVQRGMRRSIFALADHFGLTRAGDLVFVPGSNGGVGEFAAVEPGGAARVLPLPPKEYYNFRVSANGKHLAATSRGISGMEVWIYDVATGQGDRIAVGQTTGYPTWSSDGALAFTVAESAGSTEELMLLTPGSSTPMRMTGPRLSPSMFVTPKLLVGNSDADVVVATLDGKRVIRADTLKLAGNQYYPMVSPDRRWLAYAGSEKGITQVFVTPFPSMERQYRVSTDAASEPLWLPDGSLVHRTGRCWSRQRPIFGAAPPLAAPVLMFCDERFLNTSGPSNEVMPDGRILYLRTMAPTTAGYVRVIRRWRQRVLDRASGQ